MRAVIVVVLSIVLASATGSARAQSFYIGAQGGYNDLFDAELNEDCWLFTCTSEGTAIFDEGHAIGGVVGFEMPLGVRIEGEFTYRENRFQSIGWVDASRATSGDVRSQTVMANLYYDFGIGPLRPYLGGGGGVMFVEFDDVRDANGPLFSGERTLLAGQVIAGVGISPLPNTTIYLDYRALFAEDANFTFASTQRAAIAGQGVDIENGSQTVMVGIRQSF